MIIEAYLLSSRAISAQAVKSRLEGYVEKRGGRGLIAQYALALAGLTWPAFTDVREHANRLLENPSVKDMRALGECISSILDGRVDAGLFQEAIRRDSYWSRQEFRGHARRFVCMPVMALASICPGSVPIVSLDQALLPTGYLRFQRDVMA